MSVRGPTWIREYIGIPYKERGYSKDGCHCWGLVCLVQEEQFGRKLMRHDEFHYSGRAEAELAGEIVQKYLPQVTQEWYKVSPTQVDLGDVILLRLLGHPIHTAIAVSETHMLHQLDGCDSVCEEIFGPVWRNRVLSVWRHSSARP